MDMPKQTNEEIHFERYSFKFTENEIKDILRRQRTPWLNTFIVTLAALAVLFCFRFVYYILDPLFWALCGILLFCTLLIGIRTFSFIRKSPASIHAVTMREYVYTFSKASFQIEVYENEEKRSEESRNYSEIQAISNTGAHLLLTVVGRLFVVRKSDLPQNSLLFCALEEKIQAANAKNRKEKIARTVVLLSAFLMILFGTLGKIYENYTNEQAIFKMKAAISETYDDYEFLTHFNIRKDGRFVDAWILIESNNKVDILGYASQDGKLMTVEKYIGLTPESGNAISYLRDGSQVIIRIYPHEADIPKAVSIKAPILYNGQTMYFCMTYAA